MGVFSKIAGIIDNFFQFDRGSGPGLKNEAGAIAARNAADSAYAIARGATPVGNDDLTTKAYVDGLVGSGQVRSIRIPIGTNASYTSVTSIPANAIVYRASLDIQTAYDNGATIEVGRTGSTSLLMTTTDSAPTNVAPNMYQVPQDTDWGGAALPLLVTIANAPTVGAGFAIVEYALPSN